METTVNLISETIQKNEYGYPVSTKAARTVLARVDSIGSNEFFQAEQVGLAPTYRFTINKIEYNKEKLLEHDGERYGIYRTYINGDYIELYVEYKGGVNIGNHN